MGEIKDENLSGNEIIEENLVELKRNPSDEMLAVTLTSFRKRMNEGGHMVVAVEVAMGESYQVRTITLDGQKWMVAFTSFDEELKGSESVMSTFTAPIRQIFDMALGEEGLAGVMVNPWDKAIRLNKKLIHIVIGK